jgi:hypothetical protein
MNDGKATSNIVQVFTLRLCAAQLCNGHATLWNTGSTNAEFASANQGINRKPRLEFLVEHLGLKII